MKCVTRTCGYHRFLQFRHTRHPEPSRTEVGKLWPNLDHHLFLHCLWTKKRFLFLSGWNKKIKRTILFQRVKIIWEIKISVSIVKSYWNIATLISSHIVYSCFVLQQQNWILVITGPTEPKTFTIYLFTGKGFQPLPRRTSRGVALRYWKLIDVTQM